MDAMRALLDPKAIAVVGASQRPGRGRNVIANLRDCGFTGEIFAVNPRYPDCSGYKCVRHVRDLPPGSTASWWRSPPMHACDVLEAGVCARHPRGHRAGGGLRRRRARRGAGARGCVPLADKGMCICGPNCFGLINVRSGAAAYSGPVPTAAAAAARSHSSRRAAASGERVRVR